jgi:hypothetical protein
MQILANIYLHSRDQYAYLAAHIVGTHIDGLGFERTRVYVYALQKTISVTTAQIVHAGAIVEIKFEGKYMPVYIEEIEGKYMRVTHYDGNASWVYCTRTTQVVAAAKDSQRYIDSLIAAGQVA